MVFSEEDKVLIKVLHQEKGYGAKKVYQRVSKQKLVFVICEEVADEE